MDHEKMEPLHDWFGGAEALTEKADIYHLDLEDDSSIDEAVKGATYVIHTASPVGIEQLPRGPQDMIKPAVEGTLSVMRAAVKYGVKRVVITSSLGAIES